MKERLLEIFESKTYQPKTFEVLAEMLEINESEKPELKATLDMLLDNYDIFLSKKKDKYILPKDAHIYKGTISIIAKASWALIVNIK
jgi:exoribonuclease R